MKIISRSVGEQIVIDDHITLTIQEINDDKIVLSMSSSRNTSPGQEEIFTLQIDEQTPSFQFMTP